jgi:ParB family chromosome partitioning protein
MAKKLFEKAGLIQIPAAGSVPAASRAERTEESAPKTAPGSMLQFMSAQSSAIKEAESLRSRIEAFEGAIPTRLLDCRLIRPSQWANRHDHSFSDADFAALKGEIESSGGNVQPIKVRPISSRDKAVEGRGVGPSNPPESQTGSFVYEIVFGHRRHRACQELGLPVLALIEPVDDQTLFVNMERENRSRKNLSAWEQGCMYARALDQGLYASNRQLASAIGRDLGDVGKALSLARLPESVVNAFASPLDLQFRWAKPLGDVQQRDPEGLLRRASEVRARALQIGPKAVFDFLVGATPNGGQSVSASVIPLKLGRKSVGKVSIAVDGTVHVRIDVALDAQRRQEMARLLETFLGTE